MTQQYIFLFSVGPVQSFIAQARKTQDLYGGSRLLSHLCLKALEFATTKGIAIVFPFIDEAKSTKSIPNRFVGIMDNAANSDLQTLGQDIEDYVQDEFEGIANETLLDYNIGLIKGFAEQIKNHLDIHWLFYPIETNYETDYAHAEQWLGAVKNARIFQQNPEKGRKCSLDGERNVKFYRLQSDESYKTAENKLFQTKQEVYMLNEKSKTPISMVEQGEGLSAVGFVKRAFDKKGFPSTASIAKMNAPMKDEKAYKAFKTPFGNNFDDALCFEENLTEYYLTKYGYSDVLEKIGLKKLRDLRDKAFDHVALQKYYALIVFDGDHMGKIMNGYYLETDSSKLKLFQQYTSKLLSNYADWATTYLDAPKGKTVYAGGDDFLGFIQLDSLFEVMQDLYNEFLLRVSEPLKAEKAFENNLASDFKFTISAGVVIAHYKTPLSIVLKKARAMEHLAKEDGERDAFALSVLKHSGESHETVFKWAHLPNLQYIHTELSKENFSNTFIKNIQIELGDFEGNFKNPISDFVKSGVGKQLAKSEIQRLVKGSQMPNKPLGEMPKKVLELFNASRNFENFVEALNIAQFTKRILKSE